MLLPAIVVLSAETTVETADTLLRPYADGARVVISRRAGPALVWYLLTAREIRSGTREATPHTALREVLNLDSREPVPTRQASAASAAGAESPILVIDGEQLVGILELEPTPVGTAVPDEEDEPAWRAEIAFRRRTIAADRPLFEVVRVFYGTDRRPEADPRMSPYYGGSRGELTLGTVEVSIPAHRDKGTLPRPSWWRLEFRESPARHVMITRVEPLARNQFVQQIRGSFAPAGRKHALLFVHGYNVPFADAAMRAAQLVYDLRTDENLEFPGLPLLYSWPSQGHPLQYLADETNIEWTRPNFAGFLRLALAEIGADIVHVIAHSMGNRALIECLRAFDMSALPPGSGVLDQVVFAAPDFDADTFRNLAAELSGRARRYTLYASSEDQALKASRHIRSDLARAGESGVHMVVVNGVDTIDASNVDTSLLGHGYFGERTVLADIFYLLKDGKSPDHRYGLLPRSRSNLRYWEFAP